MPRNNLVRLYHPDHPRQREPVIPQVCDQNRPERRARLLHHPHLFRQMSVEAWLAAVAMVVHKALQTHSSSRTVASRPNERTKSRPPPERTSSNSKPSSNVVGPSARVINAPAPAAIPTGVNPRKHKPLD